jgi:hypothetical protein
MPGKVLLFSQQSSLGQSRRRGVVVRPSKSANSTRPKPDWSPYLTPDGQYSLSKEEQLRRKQLAISKHNVLLGGVVPSREMRTFKNIAMGNVVKPSPKKLVETSKDDSAEKSSSTSKDLTALDLLSPIATPSKVRPFSLLLCKGTLSDPQPPLHLPTPTKRPAGQAVRAGDDARLGPAADSRGGRRREGEPLPGPGPREQQGPLGLRQPWQPAPAAA